MDFVGMEEDIEKLLREQFQKRAQKETRLLEVKKGTLSYQRI